MPDKETLFAQFDGETIGDRRYALGEEISADTHSAVITILKTQGRIGPARPTSSTLLPIVALPIEAMTRAELESELLRSVDFSGRSDDELRERLREIQDEKAEAAKPDDEGSAADAKPAPDSYEELKEKPLDKMTTADLTTVADAEGVTFAESVRTNKDRAEAIQTKRDAA